MSNIIHIHNPDAAKRILENNTFQYDSALMEARHKLTTLFIKRMQEDHSPVEINRICQIHNIAITVTTIEYLSVIEGAIRDLKEMDPNYVPDFRRRYN